MYPCARGCLIVAHLGDFDWTSLPSLRCAVPLLCPSEGFGCLAATCAAARSTDPTNHAMSNVGPDGPCNEQRPAQPFPFVGAPLPERLKIRLLRGSCSMAKSGFSSRKCTIRLYLTALWKIPNRLSRCNLQKDWTSKLRNLGRIS